MKTLLLLMLVILLPSGAVSAAPTGSGPPVSGELARDRLQGMDTILLSSDQVGVARSGQYVPPLTPAQGKAVSARLPIWSWMMLCMSRMLKTTRKATARPSPWGNGVRPFLFPSAGTSPI